MQHIECQAPILIAEYTRRVISTGQPLKLVNVVDKPVAGGIVNMTSVKMRSSGKDIIISPA